MKIAVHVDDSGQPVSIYQKGRIRLYEGEGPDWAIVDEFAYELPFDGKLPALRASLILLARRVGTCRVLLSGEVRGFAYSFLQEHLGFHIWKSAGDLTRQLAAVAELEAQRTVDAAACACPSVPDSGCSGCGTRAPAAVTAASAAEDLGEGRRRFDLVAAMAADPALNSRLALLPLLTAGPVGTLEILADHRPRWFAAKLEELGLAFEEVQDVDGLRLIVTQREQSLT